MADSVGVDILLKVLFSLSVIVTTLGTQITGNENQKTLDAQGVRPRQHIVSEHSPYSLLGGYIDTMIGNNRASAINIIKRGAPATPIYITKFTDSSGPGKKFSVYVDDTMTRLVFEAKVERSHPVILATTPMGLPSSVHPTLQGSASVGTVTVTMDITVTSADYGIWNFMKLDANKWDVTVQGYSPVHFTHAFLESAYGGMFYLPVKGNPVQGVTHKATITVPNYAMVQSVDMMMLWTLGKPFPIAMKPVTSSSAGKYQATFKMPVEKFMIGIQGKDKSNHAFRRLDATEITPVTLNLIVPPYTGVKLYENEQLDINFTVINKASLDQDVDVRIHDDQNFAEPPNIISATLKPGQNFTGTFVIKAGTVAGVTTTVTITANPFLGRGKISLGPTEIRQFTVERNYTTTTSTTTIPSTSMPTTTLPSTVTSTVIPSASTSASASTTRRTSTSANTTPSPSTSISTSPSLSPLSSATPSVSTPTITTPNPSPPTAQTHSATSLTTSSTTAIIPLSASSSMTTKTSVIPSTSTVKNTLSAHTFVPTSKLASSSTISVLPPSANTNTIATAASTKKSTSLAAVVSASSISGSSITSKSVISTTPLTGGSKLPTAVARHVSGKTTALVGHVAQSAVTGYVRGKATTATPNEDENTNNAFNKGEVFAAAIISGMSAGVIIGVVAIVTMGVVLRKAINKPGNVVEPITKRTRHRTFKEQDVLKWT